MVIDTLIDASWLINIQLLKVSERLEMFKLYEYILLYIVHATILSWSQIALGLSIDASRGSVLYVRKPICR